MTFRLILVVPFSFFPDGCFFTSEILPRWGAAVPRPYSDGALAQVLVNEFEELLVHRFGFGGLAAFQGFGGAMMQVILHQVARYAAQRFLHRGNLRDDVRAVAVGVDHFLQAANLPFDAGQPVAIRILDLRIDGHSFAPFAVSANASSRPGGPGQLLPVSSGFHSTIPSPPIYTSIPYICQTALAVTRPQWLRTLLYFFSYDPRPSDLRIAAAAYQRAVHRPRTVRQHLRLAQLSLRRSDKVAVVRVRRFAAARNAGGACPRTSQNRHRAPNQLTKAALGLPNHGSPHTIRAHSQGQL